MSRVRRKIENAKHLLSLLHVDVSRHLINEIVNRSESLNQMTFFFAVCTLFVECMRAVTRA
jgi:hypothetical protein